jgi:hypothetical protein
MTGHFGDIATKKKEIKLLDEQSCSLYLCLLYLNSTELDF